MIVVHHQVSRAEERHAKARDVVCIDCLETVDQDFDFGGIWNIRLPFGIDFDVRHNELVVWNCDVQVWIYGYGEIAIISKSILVGRLFKMVMN